MTDEGKYLVIIPDVHGRAFWREAVEARPEDEFIFLGDYLDPYPQEGVSDAEAFGGLQDIIDFKKQNPDRMTLLWGNHDLHYLYPELLGSRYDFDNAVRNAHSFWSNQHLFKMAYETVAGGKRFLFSHAGVVKGWISQTYPGLDEEDISADFFNSLVGNPHFMKALEDVSVKRGGDKPYGSIVWADILEHLDKENQYPGIVQVFGHSMLPEPLLAEGRVCCLDCSRPFVLNREDGEIYCLE